MGCSTPRFRLGPLVLLATVSLPAAAVRGDPVAPPPGRKLSFNEHIRPILSENCFACHGPDGGKRQAGLRLDTHEAATTELESGMRAIVPQDVAASEILARVVSDDPDVAMPPPSAKLGRLTTEQVATLRRWIAEGAEYQPHWAFLPPPKPTVDDLSSGLDAIVARKLADRGLAPQSEATRAALIRRASFDITGLPPTPEEVAAFVADTAPDAYEKLLDRLLASPRYGERMAADWLDLARYADSYGFQVDRPRPTMWPWRDWVIKSFNENLPWDQFAVWQVAGDLLPDATAEQRLATAFNRLHQQESEGGSVEEEYRVTYVNDRVTTFGTAFLGLTLECCRCHDHKFDPLSQRDFYSLFAFFDDIDEAGLYSYFTDATPTPKMRLLNGGAADALTKAEESCTAAAAALIAAEEAAVGGVADWLAGKAPKPAAVAARSAGTIPGELARYAFDGSFANGVAGGPAASSPAENTFVAGRDGQAIRLTGDHPVNVPAGNFRRSHPFTVAAWIRPAGRSERAVVFHRSRAWTDAASRGYELLVVDGHLRWSLIHFWPGDAASVRMQEPLPIDRWVHVAVTSDGSGTAAGLGIFVDGHLVATSVVHDNLSRDITGGGGDTITIGERFRDHGFKDGLVDDFRVFDRQLSPLEIRELVEPGPLAAAVAGNGDAERLGGYVAAALDETAAGRRKALEDIRRSRDDLAERPTEIMVMRESPAPKTAFVLERGEYDKRREAVGPGTPAALPPLPADAPRNRLGLARWLVDPEHPLLARVTVNRVWQGLFGTGLVTSPEDLGSQAPRPEYPELLDLLAWKFSHPVADGGLGWDMKSLVKAIMRSRTYRQRSVADAKTMADDPLNTWLARGPRHRLPAEMIRDGALAACGLLVEKIGGPPVKTYDMPDSFKPEQAGSGESLYRRSVYTYWRRTGPGPMLEVFDVPSRVVCVAHRDTTNTPLHAFVLLNGQQFVEAARVLAERLLADQEADARPPLERAFERLTSRPADDREREILRTMHGGQLDWYRAHPEDAARLVTVGQTRRVESLPAVEVAATAAVINALLNYDGCVVKQ
ncbi:MAG: DUF1549 domain-containing protein [Planctomycetes bacterium]|nr:DUF1549 domain-containing protein [Planctomycetota bacterium]